MSGPSFHGSVNGHNVLAGTTVASGGVFNAHFNTPASPPPSKPCRVIPFPRNESIIDRTDLFARLEALLPPTEEYTSAALWGLGGSGKTQIALEYAYRRCRDPACSVFWAHADNETTFVQDYKKIAQKLRLDNNLDGEELLEAVREGIEAQSRWLLVLDNADNLELFGIGETSEKAHNLVAYIPNGTAGTVLWTSRDKQISGALVSARRALQITSMRETEAKALLQLARGLNATIDKPQDVIALLEELQFLPLAISQAGAYIRRTSISIHSYLSKLLEAKKRWPLLQRTQFDRHRRPGISNSILETWTISIDLIQQESEIAYHILHTLAYLDNQGISMDLISAIAAYGTKGKILEEDPSEIDERLEMAITRLTEFSFLAVHILDGCEKVFDMHKLVQEAIRYNVSIKRYQGIEQSTEPSKFWNRDTSSLQRQVDFINDAWKSNAEPYFSSIALRTLLDLFPSGERETWAKCEKYLPHAVRVGDWAELSEKEEKVSDLLFRVSNYLYRCGRWRELEQVDVRVHGLLLKVLGRNHLKTITAMENLAQLYDTQNRYKESHSLSSEALILRQQILGEKHPDTIWAMTNVATSFHFQRKYRESEKMTLKAMRLQREILGERHLDTIASMEHLARTQHEQGKYEESEKRQIRVLKVRKEVLGERHPETIRSMRYLSLAFHTRGQYEKAEAIGARALELSREISGEKHPDTLKAMYSLANAWYMLGRGDDAIALMEKCWLYRCDTFGSQDDKTVKAKEKLAEWRIQYGLEHLHLG